MHSQNRQKGIFDVTVRALHNLKPGRASPSGFDKGRGKWKAFQGPNPLMMMGLDRS